MFRATPKLTGSGSVYTSKGVPSVEAIASREAGKYGTVVDMSNYTRVIEPTPKQDKETSRRGFLQILGASGIAYALSGCTFNGEVYVNFTPERLKELGYGHVVNENTPTTTIRYTLGDNPYNLWRRIRRLGNWWEIQAYEIVKKDIKQLTSEWAKVKIFTEQDANTIYSSVVNPSFFESRHKISDVLQKSKSLEQLSEEMTKVAKSVNPAYKEIKVVYGLSPEGELTLEIVIIIAIVGTGAAAASGAFAGGGASGGTATSGGGGIPLPPPPIIPLPPPPI